MIFRVWHGRADPKNSRTLENLWQNEILPSIKEKKLNGFLSMTLLRNDLKTEIEYTTIIQFKSLDGIKQFAGNDWEKAVVPPSLQKLLKSWDLVCQHHEVVTEIQSH